MEGRENRFYGGYRVTFACFIIFLFVFGIQYTFGLYLKPLLAEFGWSRASIAGAYSLSWLLQGPSSLLMGRLNDKYGPRLVLTLCGILLFAGIMLTARTTAIWHLYLYYGVFFGIGTGGTYVPMVSTIARWFVEKRNTMTGIAISGMGFGTFVFSPIAAHLISVYGWRTSYTILGIVLLIVVLSAAQFLHLNPHQQSDPASSIRTGTRDVEHDRRTRPLSLKKAVATTSFWTVFGMFFCFGFCLTAILVHIAPYATDQGKTTAAAAALVAVIGIASIAGKILFGRLGDRIGATRIYILCFFIMFAAMVLLVSAQHIRFYYIFAALFGLAYGGNACAQSPLAAALFGLASHGAIMGALNIGFTAGATLGPSVCAYLFDLESNYALAFIGIQAFSILGFLLSVFLKRHTNAA